MAKGVLWVSSRVTQPEKLSDDKFCEWYEDTHIPEVLALPGIPSAVRFEALTPQPSKETWSSEAPWLTVYEMPDIDYRESADFKALDGQSEPSKELLEGIFLNARFDTRFYKEVQCFEPAFESKGGKRFLISAALEPPQGAEQDFDDWYRKEHIPVIAQAPGYVRSR
ncbi:hypothetical protein CC86DRAFT_247794, partial [Ophiobolus disseminans]